MDYIPFALKYVWVKLPYSRNPRKALVAGIDFENERLMLKYTNKYNEELIIYHEMEDIITPEQMLKLKLPELWDEDHVKKQTNIRGSPGEPSTTET